MAHAPPPPPHRRDSLEEAVHTARAASTVLDPPVTTGGASGYTRVVSDQYADPRRPNSVAVGVEQIVEEALHPLVVASFADNFAANEAAVAAWYAANQAHASAIYVDARAPDPGAVRRSIEASLELRTPDAAFEAFYGAPPPPPRTHASM